MTDAEIASLALRTLKILNQVIQEVELDNISKEVEEQFVAALGPAILNHLIAMQKK